MTAVLDQGPGKRCHVASVAGLFHVFNVLCAQNSDYTAFDPMDYDSVMKSRGCMIMGVTTVREVDHETSIANALKANLEKTLLAGGFDLKTATAAVLLISPEMMETVNKNIKMVSHFF